MIGATHSYAGRSHDLAKTPACTLTRYRVKARHRGELQSPRSPSRDRDRRHAPGRRRRLVLDLGRRGRFVRDRIRHGHPRSRLRVPASAGLLASSPSCVAWPFASALQASHHHCPQEMRQFDRAASRSWSAPAWCWFSHFPASKRGLFERRPSSCVAARPPSSSAANRRATDPTHSPAL